VKNQFNVVAISGSLGDSGNYQTQAQCPTYFDSAIDAAYNAGIVSVFASGNNGYMNGISYPGCSLNAIAVGATDKLDNIASFSNRGQLLDILAPGVSITSTKANNLYGVLSGTSQATPHVSGVVALLSHYASLRGMTLTPDQIKQILQNTGKPIGSWKRVDAFAAVQSLAPPNTPPVANIVSPQEGASVLSPVTLEGTGSDAEDGALVSDKLSWSSDVSGPVGTGSSVQANLPAGAHTVTLTATDSSGAKGTAVIRITVQPSDSPPPNTQPTVTISSPSGVVQSPVTFEGSANDAEDGVLAGTWSEGETILGTGNQLTVPLSPGEHTVKLSAQDSQGMAGEASVTFTSQTCQLDVDKNGNNEFDIGDLVLLISNFFSESMQCNPVNPQSFCVVELDRNSNGNIEVGDFVLLLRAYAEDNLQNAQGQSCV
jgi:hypothetical protein